jgi:hypothetical protein
MLRTAADYEEEAPKALRNMVTAMTVQICKEHNRTIRAMNKEE